MTPRLVIAESDEILREDYAYFFWKRGLKIDVVNDALDCVELLRKCPPHALILEHDLPWGGADGVVAAMREEHHLATIPVLMISDEADPQDAHLPTTPVVAWFRKPFRTETLWDTLSIEIPELITERFLEQAESLLPTPHRGIDYQTHTRLCTRTISHQS